VEYRLVDDHREGRGEVNEGGELEEKTDIPTQEGVDMDDPERSSR
jgi:hypothetical protein